MNKYLAGLILALTTISPSYAAYVNYSFTGYVDSFFPFASTTDVDFEIPNNLDVGTGYTLILSFDNDPSRFNLNSGFWWSQSWQTDTTISMTFDNGYYINSNHMAITAFLDPNRIQLRQITSWDTNLPVGLGGERMDIDFYVKDGVSNTLPLTLASDVLDFGSLSLSVDNNIEETYSCPSPEGVCYITHDGSYGLTGTITPVPLPPAFPLFASALFGLFSFSYRATHNKSLKQTD